MSEQKRAKFGSKLGMILATAGGAVGLGNVWRFPLYGRSEWWCCFHSYLYLLYLVIGLALYD